MHRESESEKKGKRVLICHYRVGWTDGVSLEIDKRAEVLKELGWDVYLLAGINSEGADYIIEELDFDMPDTKKITKNAFAELTDYRSEKDLLQHIYDYAALIRKKIDCVLDDLNPDFILLHNIFSHGRHIACAKSFYDILLEREIPALATHHDFYWERDHFKNPTGVLIDDFLKKYVPPVLPALRHAVINSIAAKKLVNKTGITAVIIPDTLNFNISPWKKDEYNRNLLKDFNLRENDIFILQATRIVQRKGIELIPPIIRRLNSPEYLDRLTGMSLYNGKKITEKSRFVFLLAGYTEEEAIPYLNKLTTLMESEKIPYCFLDSRIAAERGVHQGVKRYSLFDTYPYADLISYPSQYEGWGNQFLEALFARKPIMVFEYPVFQEDIKPEGYRYISLGNEVSGASGDGFVKLDNHKIDDVCDKVIETLISSELNKDLDYNYHLAEKNNSHKYLSKLMERTMEHYAQ